MKCPKCGALNVKDADYCNLCSQPFKVKQLKSVKAKVVEEKKAERNEQEEKPVSTIHASPGFGNIEKKVEKVIEKTASLEQPAASKKLPFSFLDWFYPAVLATVIAFAVITVIPKEQVSISMTLGRIILLSILIGLIISAGGIVKLSARLSVTGWLLGFSGALLAFNFLFLSGFVLVKLSPNLYTRLFLGSEIIVMSSMLTVAVVLFWTLEKIPIKIILIIAVALFAVYLIPSWLILRSSINPIPVVTFVSWPTGYYILKWAQKRDIKTESQFSGS